jgi:hypothetical protein
MTHRISLSAERFLKSWPDLRKGLWRNIFRVALCAALAGKNKREAVEKKWM